ncbi:Glutamate--tRNA ligase 2 [Rhodovastum atsumiense]|uniref:Glutamate--tRNA ligase n=1 Tax=Rhodovastum atsumiense TaxID=504468 RepID=A0A5M6IIZ1_9PROT|nr:glutamate--tRNA ligase family protein [Rhodovastum atsumiense]KAA5608092.1 glutamate--tRNA ligase [Rhodovastum atsumiense]CAH2604902.1 Glutamate--tRNA ligase 2 [Rhodovastum atsumiense]
MTRPRQGSRPCVRFAAPLTGPLHIGSARIALGSWLLARRHGGRFILRLDDLEHPEAAAQHEAALLADLEWLGLDWDEVVRQSDRRDRHAAAITRLQERGRLYPCFESEAELNAKRELRHRRQQATVYDRAMLKMTPAQRAAAEAGGKQPYWRLRLSDRVLTWPDLVLGRGEARLPAISDPVLVRADGTPMPTLASAVDDIDLGITHLLRGEELLGTTGVQIDLMAALDADPDAIAFAHLHPLAAGSGRNARLPTLRGLRQDGIEPTALAASLARPGATEPAAVRDLIDGFDLRRFARADAFDLRPLLALNRLALRDLPFAAVADRLPHGATEAFWLAVRGRIDLLTEARGYWDVVAGTIVPPVIEGEGAFLRTALATLPPEPWDEMVWDAWIGALARATGRDGEALAQPLLLALTGEDHGPDLGALLPLIGRARAAQRLEIAVS